MPSSTPPIWKDLTPAALRRLALAVSLVFAVLGPLQVLMRPVLPSHSWLQLALLTISSAGMAGSIILFGRKLLGLLLGVAIFAALLLSTTIAERLLWGAGEMHNVAGAATLMLSPAQLAGQGTQRFMIGMLGVGFVASGYGMFIFVVSREVRKRSLLEAEITIAQNIQRSLLPNAPLRTSWCEIAGLTQPAKEIGGDYFDIISLSDDEILAVIGDVSGHGIGAGILAAMTKSALHAELAHVITPRRVLENLNDTIFQLSNRQSFVTFACVLLNRNTGTARVATAGHPALLHLPAATGGMEQVRTPSLGLGLKRQVAFAEQEIRLAPGDRLLLYTDGLTEATNQHGEQFEEERLAAFALQTRDLPALQFCSRLMHAVQEFSTTSFLADDASVVYIRML